MQDQIRTLKQQALDALQQVSNTESLSGWFRDYLGKKGAVTGLLKQLGTVAAEERPQMGKAINDLKAELQNSFDSGFNILLLVLEYNCVLLVVDF